MRYLGVEFFGALLTSMDSSEDVTSLSATIALLSIVIKTVDKGILQSKFSISAKLLLELLSQHGQGDDASIVRGLLGCLSVLLRAQDPDGWRRSETVKVMDSILTFVVDRRPKVRKAAHHAVCVILVSKDESSMQDFHPIAEHTAKSLIIFMESNAGNVGSDIKGALHIMTLLKEILHTFPKLQVKSTCETILKLMTLHSGMSNWHYAIVCNM